MDPASPFIHKIDLGIIFLYLIVVMAIGLHFARGEKKSGASVKSVDYFLAGKKLGWIAVGFSLFASNISSTTLIGLSGAAYATGISVSNYEWMAAIVLVFFSIFFIPYYLGTNVFTMPEFLERRFDQRSRYYFSGLTIVGNLFIDTAGTLFAGAFVLSELFGIDLLLAATVLALITGFYTAAGGLSAVVYTDIIQAVILLIGTTCIALLAYQKTGPWSEIVANTPSELLSVVRPIGDETMPWTGLLIGVPILGFYFWCTNQFIVQRVLGARDINHARWGSLFGGFLKLTVLFIMVYPGIMARQLYPDLARADAVFPTMVTSLLPLGLKGLILAGLIAAIMSSIDSTLHSVSTLVTVDFVKKANPKLTPVQLTRVGRFTTVVFMIFSIAWVPVVASSANLFAYLQEALAYLFPPVAAIFIIGLFWKRATGKGALAGLVFGHAVAIVCFILTKFFQYTLLHFLEMAGVFAAVSALTMGFVSLLDAPPDPLQVEKYTWSRKRMKELTSGLRACSWWQDYRIHSGSLLLLTFLLVIFNW